jgi:hypothetical protein
VTANGETGNFLKDALDMSRAGVSGHSMGGGSTASVLARNAGYAAGFCFAPLFPGDAVASQVRLPLGIAHGTGDTVLNWQTSALPLFQRSGSSTGIKALYLMNGDCNHSNVAGLALTNQTHQQVWARCARVATGFFDRFLKERNEGLEEVLGPTARAEARLTSLYAEVETPELWNFGSTAIGQPTRLTIAGEPGAAAAFAAAGTAALNTPFGVLRLDPATIFPVFTGIVGQERLLSENLTIPNDPALVGARVPLQAVALSKGASLRLSVLLSVEVTS